MVASTIEGPPRQLPEGEGGRDELPDDDMFGDEEQPGGVFSGENPESSEPDDEIIKWLEDDSEEESGDEREITLRDVPLGVYPEYPEEPRESGGEERGGESEELNKSEGWSLDDMGALEEQLDALGESSSQDSGLDRLTVTEPNDPPVQAEWREQKIKELEDRVSVLTERAFRERDFKKRGEIQERTSSLERQLKELRGESETEPGPEEAQRGAERPRWREQEADSQSEREGVSAEEIEAASFDYEGWARQQVNAVEQGGTIDSEVKDLISRAVKRETHLGDRADQEKVDRMMEYLEDDLDYGDSLDTVAGRLTAEVRRMEARVRVGSGGEAGYKGESVAGKAKQAWRKFSALFSGKAQREVVDARGKTAKVLRAAAGKVQDPRVHAMMKEIANRMERTNSKDRASIWKRTAVKLDSEGRVGVEADLIRASMSDKIKKEQAALKRAKKGGDTARITRRQERIKMLRELRDSQRLYTTDGAGRFVMSEEEREEAIVEGFNRIDEEIEERFTEQEPTSPFAEEGEEEVAGAEKVDETEAPPIVIDDEEVEVTVKRLEENDRMEREDEAFVEEILDDGEFELDDPHALIDEFEQQLEEARVANNFASSVGEDRFEREWVLIEKRAAKKLRDKYPDLTDEQLAKEMKLKKEGLMSLNENETGARIQRLEKKIARLQDFINKRRTQSAE